MSEKKENERKKNEWFELILSHVYITYKMTTMGDMLLHDNK